MSSEDAVKRARRLLNDGRSTEAMELLREELRTQVNEPDQIDRFGRFIHKVLVDKSADFHPTVLVCLGQCTTSWLVTASTALAWQEGIALHVTEGEYDNVIQTLVEMRDRSTHPDVVVLLPWNQRLLSEFPERTAEVRIEDELAFWNQAWRFVRESRSKLIQVGYDFVHPGPLGSYLTGESGGDIALVRELNQRLRKELPQGAYFIDLEIVSGEAGRRQFYDDRRYFWTRQPFSEAGAVELSRHIVAGVRAVTTGPKKVLVVDLDNTLWGGVVGEVGCHGIELGENPDGQAYCAFQQYLRRLKGRGCILAVCSKNNPDDALEPFDKNPAMVLKRSDFAAFDASWDAKSLAIERIAQQLNLGLDAFVFFDDNPAEREQVRRALPEVSIIDVPEDPAGFVEALQGGLYFESVRLTEADSARADQYQAELTRKSQQQQFDSIESYLESLEMIGTVSLVDDASLGRVVQLLGKTNQFNLTTRRHGVDDVLALLSTPRSLGLTFQLKDRFGDYGLIGVAIAVPDDEDSGTMYIDTLLMSCRVIARTMEQFIANVILDRAQELNYHRITGEYLPTAKNALVANLYGELGYACICDTADRKRFELCVSTASKCKTYVRMADENIIPT